MHMLIPNLILFREENSVFLIEPARNVSWKRFLTGWFKNGWGFNRWARDYWGASMQ